MKMSLPDKNQTAPECESAVERKPPVAAVFSPSSGTADIPAACEPAKTLTPEEQMALFEKELKENDWGHQPC